MAAEHDHGTAIDARKLLLIYDGARDIKRIAVIAKTGGMAALLALHQLAGGERGPEQAALARGWLNHLNQKAAPVRPEEPCRG